MALSDKQLSRLANYATITGFAGLLLSAGVFIYQVLEDRAETRVQAREQTLAVYNALRLSAASDPELVNVILKAWNCEQLTSNEEFRYENYMSYLFFSGHAHFARLQEAGGDAGIWSGSRGYYRYILSEYPGVRFWWEQNKESYRFSAEFKAELENNLIGSAPCDGSGRNGVKQK